MPQNWKTYKLEEISDEVSYGYTESASWEEIGPKFLRITDIQKDFISWGDVPYCKIVEKDFIKNKLEIGDIVIARTGNSTGATICIKDIIDAVFASYLIRFRLNKEKADAFYVDFVLRSIEWKNYVNAIKGGSAQPGANAKQFGDFNLNLPPLPEQTAIASILSTIDAKIENNLAINKTLEEMAMALYKEWFVDFGPFQDGNFVESELGMIPEGWEVRKVNDFGKVITGKTPSKKFPEHFGDYMPFVTPTDFKNYGKHIMSANRGLSLTGIEKHKKNLIPKNSVIVTCIGSDMGKVALSKMDCFTNQQINSLKCKNYLYLYSYFVYQYPVLKMLASDGTTMPIINKSSFENLEILLPNEQVLKDFEAVLLKWDNTIEINTKLSQTLTTLRDTLLPKLISGEVRLKEFSDN